MEMIFFSFLADANKAVLSTQDASAVLQPPSSKLLIRYSPVFRLSTSPSVSEDNATETL